MIDVKLLSICDVFLIEWQKNYNIGRVYPLLAE